MKTLIVFYATLAATLTLGAQTASAQILNGISFGNQTNTGKGIFGETFTDINAQNETDGVNLGESGDEGTQNRADGGPNGSSAANNVTPFQGLIFNQADMTFTFTGLTAGQAYYVAVYAGISPEPTEVVMGSDDFILNNANNGTKFIEATALNSNGSLPTSANQLANYAVLQLTAAPVSPGSTSGEIVITAEQPTADTGVHGSTYNIIDGITISSTPPITTPEPASILLTGIGLFGIGLTGLVRMARRQPSQTT